MVQKYIFFHNQKIKYEKKLPHCDSPTTPPLGCRLSYYGSRISLFFALQMLKNMGTFEALLSTIRTGCCPHVHYWQNTNCWIFQNP